MGRFKILVVCTDSFGMVALHTTVLDFDTEECADLAFEKLTEQQAKAETRKSRITEVVKLY